MKVAAILLLVPSLAHAELIARVETDKGSIDVILQFQEAPKAVANFITLAEGTRPHLDPVTGAISASPYYIGEKFFRVLDTETFKIAQTGSGTGTNSGGPGYTFKDEFDPTLRHVPYVLSMANSGPNTNGSQIFFVGNSSPSHLDDVHTVFGLVTDSASRTVIDAIHGAGDNGSEITAITFDRTDPAAAAFDELAHDLPTISAAGRFSVLPNVRSRFTLDPPASVGAVLTAYRSTDLTDWTSVARSHVGLGPAIAAPVLIDFDLDSASEPSAFFHVAHVAHPESLGVSHLRSRTLAIDYSAQTHTYRFDGTGLGGTISVQFGSNEPVEGPFVVDNFFSGAHHLTLRIRTAISYGGIPFNPTINCGWDELVSVAVIGGRQHTSANVGPNERSPCTVTR